MTPALPQIENGLCLYAIGDIHGHKDRLQQLMTLIIQDAGQHPDSRKRLVFLGDYIDRGPDSRGVIDYLLHSLPPSFETVFLRGNHEEVMLQIIDGDVDPIVSWLRFGGIACLASYGVTSFRSHAPEPALLRAELARHVPPEHLQFLQKTELHHICGDYFFAHAGVHPDVDLTQQEKDDLLWIRHEFLLSKKDFGKIIVHGHTISTAPDIQPNRIGIDTGAFATGRLTCLKLVGAERRFISTRQD